MSRARAAEVLDVAGILALLTPYMEKAEILCRSEDDIIQNLQEFAVAEEGSELVGVSALHVYTRHLAEIRSLVVCAEQQGRGVGGMLVKHSEDMARELGITEVFALTYAPDFFKQHGYLEVSKEALPHKIWKVCIHCEMFSDCNEIAVKKILA